MAEEREAAEQWFLSHGLPAVLRPGALVSGLWSRTAPALAAFAVIAANSVLVFRLSGARTVNIAGRPDFVQGVVLGLLVLVLPAAILAGWLVSRLPTVQRRRAAAVVSLGVIALGAVFGGPSGRILVNAIAFGLIVLGLLAVTATGVGSILGWAARLVAGNLRHAATMFGRALPVLLLTFLVFFNGSVWTMAAEIGRIRLWVAMAFLFLLAAAFLLSATFDQVRPMLAATADGADRLSRAERLNVVFVVAFSQLGQVLMVAVATGLVFLALGMILLTPALLQSWTRAPARTDGTVLGMTIPVPDALIQTSMFLTAITFMYLAAKAVTDTEYRGKFIDPMLADLRSTLQARDRYRATTPVGR